MQPHSHAFVLRAAVERADIDWLREHLSDLLRGHEDEDDLVVFGLRLRAAGLTHSYRPGERTGELGMPSARWCLERCVRKAREAREARESAWWLGRAAHLLGDLAVPSRTRGVWHLLGDPLEQWLEAHVDDLHALHAEPVMLPQGSCGQLADSLAGISSRLPADTTRTPWGQWLFHTFGRGQRLDPSEVEEQARVLIPQVIAHTASLLRTEGARHSAQNLRSKRNNSAQQADGKASF